MWHSDVCPRYQCSFRSQARRSGTAGSSLAGDQADSDLYLSVITLGEIERGIRQQEKINPDFAHDLQAWINRTVLLFEDRLLPFGPQKARICGRLTAEIGRVGADLMMAATALHHSATVVTGNVSDFAPTGVRLENPF